MNSKTYKNIIRIIFSETQSKWMALGKRHYRFTVIGADESMLDLVNKHLATGVNVMVYPREKTMESLNLMGSSTPAS